MTDQQQENKSGLVAGFPVAAFLGMIWAIRYDAVWVAAAIGLVMTVVVAGVLVVESRTPSANGA